MTGLPHKHDIISVLSYAADMYYSTKVMFVIASYAVGS